MEPLRRDFPALKVVFEHITTREAAHYVRDTAGPLAATITAHHLLFNRNALFMSADGRAGVRPHYYCLPVLKREPHRLALIEAAASGNPRYFLGTDSAPHPKGDKQTDCGCAGCYTAASALELYAEAFEDAGRLDRLEGFASHYGADFYGLPRNRGSVTLQRRAWTVPGELPLGDRTVVPLRAGELLRWQLTN
jgi:dihydroorotase